MKPKKVEQKYATKKFYSLKSAESFKLKVGSNFNIVRKKDDKNNGRYLYHIRFKIDKSKPKYHNIDSGNDSFERFWKEE